MTDVLVTAVGDKVSGAATVPSLVPYPVADGPGGAPRPAVLVLPGGGYAGHADHEGEPVARWLNGLGVAAFVLRYRVQPNRHPLPLLDAARAVRLVRHRAAEWGVDASRVGVLGFSAGGHLAGLLATGTGPMLDGPPRDAADLADPHPGLAVLCYPVASLVEEYAHRGSAENLLGPGADPALEAELSVERRVGPESPPMFLWHTAEDGLVPPHNTFAVAGALAAHGVPVEVHVYPDGPHGIGMAEEYGAAAEWTAACGRFLRDRGWAR